VGKRGGKPLIGVTDKKRIISSPRKKMGEKQKSNSPETFPSRRGREQLMVWQPGIQIVANMLQTGRSSDVERTKGHLLSQRKTPPHLDQPLHIQISINDHFWRKTFRGRKSDCLADNNPPLRAGTVLWGKGRGGAWTQKWAYPWWKKESRSP